MKVFRTVALTGALLSSATWAFGQNYHSWQYQDRDRNDRAEYRHGYDQGRSDAQNGRRFRPSSNERDFRDGYEAGYNSVRTRDRDRDRDRDHDRDRDNGYRGWNGSYGAGAYGNGMRVAEQNGYRDGLNDGRHDRSTGHSFRPTQDDNYKSAPGYSSSMGDRQQYKNAYRQAYERGYQEGYNGRR